MSVHVENMTSTVEVSDGDVPLSPAQVDRLVQIVLKRLAERDRDARWQRQATELRETSTPFMPGSGRTVS